MPVSFLLHPAHEFVPPFDLNFLYFRQNPISEELKISLVNFSTFVWISLDPCQLKCLPTKWAMIFNNLRSLVLTGRPSRFNQRFIEVPSPQSEWILVNQWSLKTSLFLTDKPLCFNKKFRYTSIVVLIWIHEVLKSPRD